MTLLILLAILGLFCHWLTLFDSARRKTDYDWKIFVDENKIRFIIQFIVVVVFVAFNPELSAFVLKYTGKDITIGKIASFMIGFNASVIWMVAKKVTRKRIGKIGEYGEDD